MIDVDKAIHDDSEWEDVSKAEDDSPVAQGSHDNDPSYQLQGPPSPSPLKEEEVHQAIFNLLGTPSHIMVQVAQCLRDSLMFSQQDNKWFSALHT